MEVEITSDILLQAYKHGIFPMGKSRDSLELAWYRPQQRGVLPLYSFHLPRRLYKTIVSNHYQVKFDYDFLQVIEGCAAVVSGREESWINPTICSLYKELFDQGYVHTIEIWDHNELIGGLYGITIGQAFFGESMFSRRRDTSKVALVYLVACLRLGGFQLLDTQFMTDHLAQFGGVEITAQLYEQQLQTVIQKSATWVGKEGNQSLILQEIKQMR